MVAAAVVGFAHAHGVVGEVDIAVVAWGIVSLAEGVGGGRGGEEGESYRRVLKVLVLLCGG